ncbi:MAG: MFS transporter [Calditrichaeota bacterium]|nr:MAG: MFS transporter [Calditrichota bacterium]
MKKNERFQLIIIAGGILITMLPVTMLVPVLKEIVEIRFQVDSFWTHVFMSTSLIGAIIFSPLVGVVSDRISERRWLILGALIGNGLCFIGMIVAPSFQLMMLARFLEGVFHITALSGWMAGGAELAPDRRSGRIMGALGGMIMFGITIGVPLGGVIARGLAMNVLWFAAFISFVAGLIAIGLRIPRHTHSERTPVKLQESLLLLKSNPWLGIPYVYTFIDRLCVGVIVTSFTLYLADVFQMSPSQRGFTLTFFLLPFSFLTYPVGRWVDRYGKIVPLAGGSLLFGLLFMSYGYWSESQLLWVMILSGVLSAAMFTPTLAMCKDLASPLQYGTVFVGYNVAGSLGFIVGPLLGGSLLTIYKNHFSSLEAYQFTFISAGILEVACALFSLPFLLNFRKRRKQIISVITLSEEES